MQYKYSVYRYLLCTTRTVVPAYGRTVLVLSYQYSTYRYVRTGILYVRVQFLYLSVQYVQVYTVEPILVLYEYTGILCSHASYCTLLLCLRCKYAVRHGLPELGAI